MNTLKSLEDRVGTDICSYKNLDEILQSSQMDFQIEKVECNSPELVPVPGKYIIRREDNHKPLGIVGSKYNCVSTKDMLEPFHEMVIKYGAEYENAGVIGDGRRCWVTARLSGTTVLKRRPDDATEQRIMAVISNDGTGMNSYASIAHRIFCNNQIRLIDKASNNSNYKVSHFRNWRDQLDQAQLGFECALALHKEFEYTANQLDDMSMTESEMRGFTRELIPDAVYDYQLKIVDKDKRMKQLNRVNVKREEVVRLFHSGLGNLGKSRWDALNAVTEFQDHHYQSNRLNHLKNGKVNTEKRFMSNVISGAGVNLKIKAMRLLQDKSIKFKKVKEQS